MIVTEIKPYDNNQNFGRLSLQGEWNGWWLGYQILSVSLSDLFFPIYYSTHPSDSVYLPGRTSVQLTAFDRQVVNDQRSQDYTITINKEDGCDYDKLAVTLVWVEPGKLLLLMFRGIVLARLDVISCSHHMNIYHHTLSLSLQGRIQAVYLVYSMI